MRINFLYMLKMYSQYTFGLESEKNDTDDMVAFDEIIFNLVCTGNNELAKKFTRNYLKNFYKRGIE